MCPHSRTHEHTCLSVCLLLSVSFSPTLSPTLSLSLSHTHACTYQLCTLIIFIIIVCCKDRVNLIHPPPPHTHTHTLSAPLTLRIPYSATTPSPAVRWLRQRSKFRHLMSALFLLKRFSLYQNLPQARLATANRPDRKVQCNL